MLSFPEFLVHFFDNLEPQVYVYVHVCNNIIVYALHTRNIFREREREE